MQRRTVLKIIALSALSHHLNGWGAMFPLQSEERSAWTAGDYKLQFFTVAENEIVDQAMEIIIPTDDHSGGAHAARVSLFADWVCSTGVNVRNVDLFANGAISGDLQKSEWRSGLQLLKEEAARSSLVDAVKQAATAEAAPQTDLERFFVTLKQMTVVGYYSSEIGIHQEMEYQGNIVFPDFPECTRQLSKLVQLRVQRQSPTAKL